MGSSLIPTPKKKFEIPLPSEGRPIFFSVSGPARPIPAQPNFIYLFFFNKETATQLSRPLFSSTRSATPPLPRSSPAPPPEEKPTRSATRATIPPISRDPGSLQHGTSHSVPLRLPARERVFPFLVPGSVDVGFVSGLFGGDGDHGGEGESLRFRSVGAVRVRDWSSNSETGRGGEVEALA